LFLWNLCVDRAFDAPQPISDEDQPSLVIQRDVAAGALTLWTMCRVARERGVEETADTALKSQARIAAAAMVMGV
jgi:hypothetical protein